MISTAMYYLVPYVIKLFSLLLKFQQIDSIMIPSKVLIEYAIFAGKALATQLKIFMVFCSMCVSPGLALKHKTSLKTFATGKHSTLFSCSSVSTKKVFKR